MKLIYIKHPHLILWFLVFSLYGPQMFNPPTYAFKVWYQTDYLSLIFTMGFFLSLFIGIGKLSRIEIQKRLNPSKGINKFYYLIIIAYFTLVLPMVITSTSRFEGLNLTTRIIQALLLILSVYYALIDKNLRSFILTILFTLHPLATYSRSATIGIGIIGLLYFFKGKFIRSISLVGTSILLYLIVVGHRYHAGLRYVLGDLKKVLDNFSVETLSVITKTITPYFSIDIFFENLFYNVDIDIIRNIPKFLIYLLPFPGKWMPKKIYVDKTSLSEYIGIKESVFGLNSGLIVESYLWLGFLAFPVAFLIGKLLKRMMNNSKSEIFKFTLFLSFSLFLLMSTIAPIRSSSRILIYLIFFNYAIKLFNRLIIR